MFKPGQSGNPNGRPKGSVDQSTLLARQAIANLVDQSSEKLLAWMDDIAKESPKDAMRAFIDICEYHIPKLARSEHTGKDGSDLPTPIIVGTALDVLPESVRAKIRQALEEKSKDE